MVMGKRPPLDEWLSLFRATIAAEGITTGAGAAAGTSIVDLGLAGSGANSFVSMLLVLYPGQPLLVDSQNITAFNNITGEVTYAEAYKGVAAAIPAGVPYKIVTSRFAPASVPLLHASGTQLAVITTEHELATAVVAGVFTLHVDTINMAAGDILELRIYQMVLTGGAARVAYFMTWYGAQPVDDLIKVSLAIPNDLVEANALRFTLLQTFGTGRNFPWKVIRR